MAKPPRVATGRRTVDATREDGTRRRSKQRIAQGKQHPAPWVNEENATAEGRVHSLSTKDTSIMKRIKAAVWIAAIIGMPAAFVRASSGETIEHGEFGAGSNVPGDSRAICADLPDGVEFIPELTSGWALTNTETGRVRLIFSNLALECKTGTEAATLKQASDNCISAWSSSFELPAELLRPGTYDLSQYLASFEPLTAHVEPGFACSSCSSAGPVAGPRRADGMGPDALLEIYSVSDNCITGRIAGLTTGQNFPPPPEYNGGFHAVRCE